MPKATLNLTIHGTGEAILIQTNGAPFEIKIQGYGEVNGFVLKPGKTYQYDGMRHVMIETLSVCVALVCGDVLAYLVDGIDGQRRNQARLIEFSKIIPSNRMLVVGSESAKRLCAYYGRRKFPTRVVLDLDFLEPTFLPRYCIGTVGGRVYACNGFKNLLRIATKISEALQPEDPVFIHLNLGPQYLDHLDVLYAVISLFRIDHVPVSIHAIGQILIQQPPKRSVLVSPLPSFWPMDFDVPHRVAAHNRKDDPNIRLDLRHVIRRRPPPPKSCWPLIGYKPPPDGYIVTDPDPSDQTVYGLSLDTANVNDLHADPSAIVRCICASSRTFQVLWSAGVAIESVPVVLFELQ